MYEYYFAIMHNISDFERSYTGAVYELNYKLDSSENMARFMKALKDEGYKNAVILFFKQLNE